MLNHVATIQVGQQIGDRQEGAHTSKIHEFLSMISLRFIGSSTTEVSEKLFSRVEEGILCDA